MKRVFNGYSLLSALLLSTTTSLLAQPPTAPKLGAGPWVIETYEEAPLFVSVVTRTLDHPFGMAFLPSTTTADNSLGDVLISERTGKVRLLKKGKLIEAPVVDLAKVFSLEQLFDLKLHPQFTKNGLIYFTYIKTAPNPNGTKDYWVTTALGRGRFTGDKLVDLQDIYVAKAWSSNFGGASSRLHFLPDGTLLFGVSHRLDGQAPQKLDSDIGKILRLNDDGSVPHDNPFIGVEGALPEIYTWGNRSVMDFTVHPETGEVWELENGPQGGDEVNRLKPGANYGWPIATYGRDYDGKRLNPQPWVEGTELPEIYWVPSITVAGMTFYTGNKFPKWKGNLFVTSMIQGRIAGTGHLERVKFNKEGEMGREQLLNDLHQRIRYVQQGPDGLLYLLTDDSDGALLRVEPATAAQISAAAKAAGSTAVAAVMQDDTLNSTALFAAQDCRACHSTTDALVGPSYQAIAKRYDLTDANVALLASKIIAGGSGQWGDAPMAPHASLSKTVAAEMAQKILMLQAKGGAD